MEIVLIIGVLLIAAIPAFIANSKGRSFFPWFIYGLFLFPFAMIHAIVIKPNENADGMKKCPSCASAIPIAAKICPSCQTNLESVDTVNNPTTLNKGSSEDVHRKPSLKKSIFEGDRDVLSPRYQLFLTKKFNIEKNATLEKYVIDEDLFDTLNDSLVAADELYSVELKYKEQQQQEKKEQEQAEKKRLEYVKKGFLGEYKHRFLVREDGTVFIDNPNGWSEVCSSLKEAIKKHGPVVKEDM